MLKTAHLAEAFHMNYEVHHGGNSLNNMAQLHFACAIRNTDLFRGAAAAWRAQVRTAQRHPDRQGRPGPLPEVPGIGAQFDLDLIKRKQIADLS